MKPKFTFTLAILLAASAPLYSFADDIFGDPYGQQAQTDRLNQEEYQQQLLEQQRQQTQIMQQQLQLLQQQQLNQLQQDNHDDLFGHSESAPPIQAFP